MTKLFVNGCSYTRGTPLSLTSPTAAWSYKLANMLGYTEIVNESYIGGSNERILRTTIESICSPCIPPDLAVIQFTYPERFEAAHPDQPEFVAFTPQSYTVEHLTKAYEKKHGPVDKLESKFCRTFYNMNVDHQNKLYSEKLIYQMLLLQNFFENQGIDFIFIVWPSLHRDVFSSSAFRSINSTNVLNYHNGKTYPIRSTLIDRGFELCNTINMHNIPDNHFKDDAHQFIAESLYQFIKSGKPLLPPDINKDAEYEEVVHIYD